MSARLAPRNARADAVRGRRAVSRDARSRKATPRRPSIHPVATSSTTTAMSCTMVRAAARGRFSNCAVCR